MEESTSIKETYNISGTAWIDNNKNGQKDENETKIVGLKAFLIDAKTNQIVKNEDGSDKISITDDTGKYKFTNLDIGKYIVSYEFDNNKYNITTYKKNNASNEKVSYAIKDERNLENEINISAKTDYIELIDEDVENINIGLIENKAFDISLNKEISNVTVISDKGAETKEYESSEKAKVKVDKNDSDIIVKYKFTVKNEGDTVGYVNNLVNDLPSGLEFSSELNSDWYKGTDGKLYTTKLSGIGINP